MYKEIGRNAITFGGRSLDQAWEEWNRTGDPTQFQQASGTFLIGALGAKGVESVANARIQRIQSARAAATRAETSPVGANRRTRNCTTSSRSCRSKQSGSLGTRPWPRGEAIEGRLGQNLPQNFPTIDRFENGVATSIKSMDLSGSSYLDPANITRVGQGYIDKVAGFQGRNWAGTNIRPGDVTGRGLDLAVPPGTATPGQQQALQGLIGYGKQRGVNVRIVEIQ